MSISTQDRIFQLIKEKPDIDSCQVAKELDISYETVSRHLKNLVEEGKLERYAKGNPWNYHYRLPPDKKSELTTFLS